MELKWTTSEGSAMTKGVVKDKKEKEPISCCPEQEKNSWPQTVASDDVSGPKV